MEKPVKYVFFQYADYINSALSQLRSDPNVLLVNFKNYSFIQSVLVRIFLYRELRYLRMFIPRRCFRKIYDPEKKISKSDKVVFVIYEQYFLSLNTRFYNYLKSDYKNAKLVFVFTNTLSSGVNKDHLQYILANFRKYDLITTFNEIDALQYGFEFYDQIYSRSYIVNSDKPIFQVGFCGLDKGRKILLDQIKNKLDENFITNDICISQKGSYIPFDVVQTKTSQVECILEVLANPTQPGCSIRVAEAIANGKKILTNNPYIKSKPYYKSSQISYFSSAEDLDINFIRRKLSINDLIDPYEVSPQKFILFINSKIFR